MEKTGDDMARQQITFYRSFWVAIQKLKKKEDRLSILEAIVAYGLDEEIRPMTDAAEGIFVLVQPTLDAANKKSKGRTEQDRGNKDDTCNEEKATRPEQDTGKITARHEQDTGKEKEGEVEGEKEVEVEKEVEKESYTPPKSTPSQRNKFGEYGRVLLTQGEYTRLLAEYGQEELDRCIRYVDELAQTTGNKNGWKDWNLVVRRCHKENWGRRNNRGHTGDVPTGNPGRDWGDIKGIPLD